MHEVREHALAVDLHDRDQLAVTALELGIAGDVDLAELELVLGTDMVNDGQRALAQVAVPRVEDDDPVRA